MAYTYGVPATQRAALGARWLDEKHPGWAYEVDPVTLDIESSHRCVIAQLHGGSFGSFPRGIRKLDPDYSLDIIGHGFTTTSEPGDVRKLDAAWVAEINTRVFGTARPPFWTRVRLGVRRLFQMPQDPFTRY